MSRRDDELAERVRHDLGMSKEQAEQYASEANEWMGFAALIQPGPNRSVVRVVDAMVGGQVEKAVRVAVSHSNGVTVFHMPASIAAQLADMIAQAAKHAASGLEVVSNV